MFRFERKKTLIYYHSLKTFPAEFLGIYFEWYQEILCISITYSILIPICISTYFTSRVFFCPSWSPTGIELNSAKELPLAKHVRTQLSMLPDNSDRDNVRRIAPPELTTTRNDGVFVSVLSRKFTTAGIISDSEKMQNWLIRCSWWKHNKNPLQIFLDRTWDLEGFQTVEISLLYYLV